MKTLRIWYQTHVSENPVYLREAGFPKGWAAAPGWVFIIAILAAGYTLTFYSLSFHSREVQAQDVAYAPLFGEWAAALVGVVVFSGAFATERQRKVDQFLVLTPLKRSQIILGKLLGRLSRLFYALCALIPLCVLWSMMLRFGRVPVHPGWFEANFGGYFCGSGRTVFAALAILQIVGAFFLAAAITLMLSVHLRQYWLGFLASFLAVAFALLLVYPPWRGISVARLGLLGVAAPALLVACLPRKLDDLLCRGL